MAPSHMKKEMCIRYKHLLDSENIFCTCFIKVIHGSFFSSFFCHLFLLFSSEFIGAAEGCFIGFSCWHAIHWNHYFGWVFMLMPVANKARIMHHLIDQAILRAITYALFPSHNYCLQEHSLCDCHLMKLILALVLCESLLLRKPLKFFLSKVIFCAIWSQGIMMYLWHSDRVKVICNSNV